MKHKTLYDILREKAILFLDDSHSSVYFSKDENALFDVHYSGNTSIASHFPDLKRLFHVSCIGSVLRLSPRAEAFHDLSMHSSPFNYSLSDTETGIWCAHYRYLISLSHSDTDMELALILLRAVGMARLNRNISDIQAYIDCGFAELQRKHAQLSGPVGLDILFEELCVLIDPGLKEEVTD